MSEEDARHAARRVFGSVARTQEDVRAVWTRGIADQLRRDLRFGVRAIVRRPGLAAVAVLTIAVGIGATAAIFSVVDGVLFKPLPFPNADRLVALWEARPAFNRPRVESAPLNYVDWAREAETFEALAAYFYGVEPMDWTSLIASTVVLGIAALGAAFRPVWRATRIDPVVALRGE